MKRAVFAPLPATGCGIAAKVDARNEYQASSERYKACLAANTADPRACEGLRLAMEADEQKYTNFSAGIQQGGSAGSKRQHVEPLIRFALMDGFCVHARGSRSNFSPSMAA